jgi:hypothetical protein
MRFITEPKHILLALSLLLILIGFLAGVSRLSVFEELLANIGIGAFVLLETAIYFVTDDHRQWRSIQYFHVISTVVLTLSVVGWTLVTGFSSYGFFDFNETIFYLFLSLFFLGQLLFIVNLISGFIRGKKVLNPIP